MYNGLSTQKALVLEKKFGKNITIKEKKHLWLEVLLRQFKSILVIILIVSLILSLIGKEYINAIVILIIAFLIVIIGFIQEYSANKAQQKLKEMLMPNTKVYRDGFLETMPITELVPGDLVYLTEGDVVPADAVILESSDFVLDESTLTGESLPVRKETKFENVAKVLDKIKEENFNFDIEPDVFMGTFVKGGWAKIIVIKTGKNTEFAKITKEIEPEKEILLNKQISKVIKINVSIAIIASLLVIVSQVLKNTSLLETMHFALALLVSSIPEGLPLVIILALTHSVKKLLKKGVLIKRLGVLEALGTTDVVCVDKTGTLTKNKLTVVKTFNENEMLLKAIYFCNDAKKTQEFFAGDPIDVALKEYAENKLNDKRGIRIEEIAFSSEKGFMKTLNVINNQIFEFVKGNPLTVLEGCSYYFDNEDNSIKPITPHIKEKFLAVLDEFSVEALRTLGVAFKKKNEKKLNDELKDLIFLGFVGMQDKLKEDSKLAVSKILKSHIDIKMITGDFSKIAQVIAKKVGLKNLRAIDMSKTNPENLRLSQYGVFARTKPDQKYEIVKALKEENFVVSMTGDGVNDAPALSNADVGIAVGNATEVAKQSADLILTDNSLMSFFEAIKEGRLVFNNIRKYVTFAISCNLAEILIILFSIIFNLPLPLTALQILFMNIFTDDLPAITLSLIPFTKELLDLKPRKRDEPLMNSFLKILFFSGSTYVALVTFITFLVFFFKTSSVEYARSIAFVTLVFFEVFFSWSFVSLRDLTIKSFYRNKLLLAASVISIVGSLTLVYSRLNTIFQLVPLHIYHLFSTILISLGVIVFADILKSILAKTNEDVI